MSKKVYPIAQDGWSYLVIIAILGVIFYLLHPYIAIIPAILFLFVAFFFRNPKRNIPKEKNTIISPADGVILSINEVQEDHYLKGKAIKVSIFLSVFNVHLNRSPVAGEVEYRSYRPGKFLPAFKSHASEINEKSFIGIKTGKWKIMVTQVTGFIARRIVCWVNVGNHLEKGEFFGLIKFGSCTEIYLPVQSKLLIKEKDKVKGGETIIGRLPNE